LLLPPPLLPPPLVLLLVLLLLVLVVLLLEDVVVLPDVLLLALVPMPLPLPLPFDPLGLADVPRWVCVHSLSTEALEDAIDVAGVETWAAIQFTGVC